MSLLQLQAAPAKRNNLDGAEIHKKISGIFADLIKTRNDILKRWKKAKFTRNILRTQVCDSKNFRLLMVTEVETYEEADAHEMAKDLKKTYGFKGEPGCMELRKRDSIMSINTWGDRNSGNITIYFGVYIGEKEADAVIDWAKVCRLPANQIDYSDKMDALQRYVGKYFVKKR